MDGDDFVGWQNELQTCLLTHGNPVKASDEEKAGLIARLLSLRFA